ncbi:MAG: tetratricopeptide repeat protein [Verrucomicrobia bacterium]|nr:tetratricopeptide repeat protein [Verrucomicrobiota bacterium]
MVFMLCAGTFAASQEELADSSASGLLSEAAKNLAAENYGAALPCLTDYLERMENIEDARVAALKQAVRLKLGKVLAYMEDSLSAANYLKQYMETLPLYRPREALKLLALTLYESEQYEPCVAAVTNALNSPLPKGLPEKSTEVNYEELSKKEMAGFTARQIKRIEKEAAEAGETLSREISGEVPDAEPDYTMEELVFLKMTLAEAYSKLDNWEASIEPYEFVVENAVAEDRKGYAIMQLVNSLIALKRFDDAEKFIVELYQTDARYDIRVNMALMSAAAALYAEAEYDQSLMLYRMVLPRSELVAYQEKKMNELRRKAGLPRVDIQISTNDTGRVDTLFGNKSAGMSQTVSEFEGGLPPKPMALLKMEESVGALVSQPSYEEDVLYRTGLLFARAGRPWEAVTSLDYVASRDPDSERGQEAFAESLMVLTDPLKKYARVEERGKQFLATYTEGPGPRRVAHALTSSYQKQELWKEIKKLLPVIEQFAPSTDPVIRQYECELYYMQAIADMVLLNYQSARAGFERVLMDYPDSHQQESATYWHAMAQLFLKNHQEALAELEAYIATYPKGNWLPSAAFHSGICLFGLEKYDEAQTRFTHVIETWPNDIIYSDACSMRGDLLASKGLLNEAQRDYEKAIATARLPRQAAYAVFQLTAMFALEDRYEEILNVVNAYLDRYGDEADVAKAAYWIGKTKLAQGLVDEAVEAYRETIVKYGGDIQQDGVDLIISELITLSRKLEDNERQTLEKNLHASLMETENVTLQLRLRVLLAKMNGTATELGSLLIAELDDLSQAPPPVLGVICDASFTQKDYSRAEELLNLFQTRFEDSDFMRAAYKLRGFGLFSTGEYDAALNIAAETQALYGTDQDAAWAQILKGRIELQTGDLEAARKTFRETLTVREWRGEPYAEATYYLGAVEEKAGELRKAFGWYQRAYFQYKGYAGGYWAAEAYLASARCLLNLGLENDMRNTFRAMLFDKYVNTSPQADEARTALGAAEVLEINTLIAQGVQTNLTVTIDAEVTE